MEEINSNNINRNTNDIDIINNNNIDYDRLLHELPADFESKYNNREELNDTTTTNNNNNIVNISSISPSPSPPLPPPLLSSSSSSNNSKISISSTWSVSRTSNTNNLFLSGSSVVYFNSYIYCFGGRNNRPAQALSKSSIIDSTAIHYKRMVLTQDGNKYEIRIYEI
jgi:hypothetical protein